MLSCVHVGELVGGACSTVGCIMRDAAQVHKEQEVVEGDNPLK